MSRNLFTIITIIIFLGYYFFTIHREDRLQVHFFDVGQGDSILLITPDKKYILVDGGPGDEVMEGLGKTIPFWQDRFDYVIATHGDSDHITGLVDVFERYGVDNFIYNGEQKDTLVYKKLMNLVNESGADIIKTTSKNDLQIGCCLYIDMLWPIEGYDETLGSNDSSVSFVASYKEFDIYLAGDLSSSYELQMLSSKNYDVEVHKASHHGSKTGSPEELFGLIQPDISIISAGKDNRYGHPHKEVLEVLKQNNIMYYRTDYYGNISIFTNGVSYTVKTENRT